LTVVPPVGADALLLLGDEGSMEAAGKLCKVAFEREGETLPSTVFAGAPGER
jgi:hypothetical protein